MIFTEKKASDLFVKTQHKGTKKGTIVLLVFIFTVFYMSLEYSNSMIERNADRSTAIYLIQNDPETVD
jgi:hypothetical protein